MTEGTSRLRVRAVVASWFTVFAAVLVALAVTGGAVAYTAHVDPGTTTEQVERTHWSADGEFHHAADVTRENPVFPVGTTLSNRSTYYSGPAPELDGRFVLTYSGAGTASVDTEADLVIQSAGEDTVYWSDREPLGGTTAEVGNGESTAVAFTLNTTALAQRQAEIQEALGGTAGELSTFVAVDVVVNGTVDGQSARLSFTHRLPITNNGETYSVGPAESGTESMTTTGTERTPREYGPFWSLGGPLLLLVGASGLIGLAFGRSRRAFALSEAEQSLVAFRAERAEFDEWVVRARLSSTFDDRPRADAESLGDVVDFAIDAGTGVVEDPNSGLFYAVADELIVVYEPPALARDELRETEEEPDGDVASMLTDADGVTLPETEGDEASEGEGGDDEGGDDGTGTTDADEAPPEPADSTDEEQAPGDGASSDE